MFMILVPTFQSFESILVVREFPHVFPIDLSNLPPNRNIEFDIDVEPGTKLVSILAYWMAPAELRELRRSSLTS